MTTNNSFSNASFGFCGNSSLWSDDVFNSEVPKFTDCFQLTVLVWVPFAWLFLTLPFYIYNLFKITVAFPLQLTVISVTKSIGCILIVIILAIEVWFEDSYGYRCNVNLQTPTSYYLAFTLKAVSFIFLSVFIQYLRVKGEVSSGILYFYWVISLVCDIIPLQSLLSENPDCPSSIAHYVYFGLIFTELLLHCFADRKTYGGYQLLEKTECPDYDASTLSGWLFSWFTPVVLKSYKKKIGKDDLWDQTPKLKSNFVVPDFMDAWKKEIRKTYLKRKGVIHRTKKSNKSRYQNGAVPGEETPLLTSTESGAGCNLPTEENLTYKRPSLYKTLWKKYWHLWLYGSLLNLVSMLGALLQPVILSALIDYIEEGKARGYPAWNGYALAFGMALCGEVDSLFYTYSMHVLLSLGLRVKSALIGTIYQKSLTMSNMAKRHYTIGEIVNLMSVDCLRIQDAFLFSYNIIVFPVAMVVGIYELWNVMGVATIGSIIIIILIGIINAFFGKLQEGYQQEVLYLKGKRIKLLNEVLNGIKVLKMYAWELVFSEKITTVRKKEMKFLSKIAIVTGFSILFSIHSPFMMHYFLILIYILMQSTKFFDPQKAFVSLSLVNIMRYPLTILPFVITGVIQGYVSVGRIQDFLWKEDLDKSNKRTVEVSDFAISIKNGTFTWDPESPIIALNDIDLHVPEGQLVAVVGQVGAGKSSIIQAILGEMEKLYGTVTIKGSLAYVPQEAWIQNLTVRDNILYGSSYIEKKYDKVLNACALQTDLKILSAGDMTEIGEKGINISGGQKQRVSLARAVYNNADIYLLDDPLSAVDSHVGKHLFKHVIGPEGMLRKKTRILVTHGVHWIPKVDVVVVMDNGRISEFGTYEELLSRKGPFAEFLKNFLLEEEESSDEEDPEIQEIKDTMWEQVEQMTSGGQSDTDHLLVEGLSRRRSIRKMSLKRQSSVGHATTRQRHLSRSTSYKEDTTKVITDPGTSGQLIQEEFSEEGATPYTLKNECDENKTALMPSESENRYKEVCANIKQFTVTVWNISNLFYLTSYVGCTPFVVSWKLVVKLSVLVAYVKAMGLFAALISVVFMSGFQGLSVYGNFWLTFWTEDSYLKNQTLSDTPKYYDTNIYYLVIFTVLGIVQGVCLTLFALISLLGIVKASGRLHSSMLNCILRSPMSFFDTTPVGRLMNRFSSDIDILDDRMPRVFRLWASMFFTLIGILVVISISTPIFLVAIVPVGILYVVILRFYLPTARQLKRIESVTRSPVFNQFSETITGASVIRAYNTADRFVEESRKRVDVNSAFFYAANTAARWIGVRVEFLGNILVFAASLFAVISTDLDGAGLGISLTYSMQIIIALNLLIQSISDMEMNIVAVERVEEFTQLSPEAEWIHADCRPPITWPDNGIIRYLNYTTRYRDGLDLVLRGIDCEIKSGEKVGIVGRTGAGKSSLTLSLFRLIEAAGGSIIIDGIKISDIGLHDLRSRITILPQDPVLFSGTLKMNLDPLEKHSDADIWNALEYAHLKYFVNEQPEKLMFEVSEGGQNLSVGQRQLVCLARTLLYKTKVLILDEATAAVDMETDELIQHTIRTQFSECTVICIAHRLNTIMDYDRIMVLDKGMIAEYDTPKVLLANTKGVFYGMAKDAGLIWS